MDKFSAMKREPCHKCDKPVFLAERFCVGAALYHRQCLKCARCGTQLKAGSFYETEIDGEFCCETCPDEEQVMQRRHDEAEEDPEKRFSVADKVALFQRVDLELTKKSLSDEEKRASLQRLANLTLVTHPDDENVENDEESDEDEEESDESENDEACDNTENNEKAQNSVCDTAKIEETIVEETIESLVREEVQKLVTSVLQEAVEKVQLIQNSSEIYENEVVKTNQTDKHDEVPLDSSPKPVPRIRTLERKKEEKPEIAEKPSKPARPPPPVIVKPPIKPRPVTASVKKDYPDDLNPFGSDDDEEIEIVEKPQKPGNPFGSDTEGDEEEVVEVRKKKPSTNPFGSEDDEEDDSFSRDASRSSDRSAKRTPVPTPRKILQTPPSRHTLSVHNVSQHSKTFGNNSEIYGSSSSLAYSDGMSTTQRRKKAKAPPPPSVLGIFTPETSNRSSRNLDYESEESTSSRGGLSSTGNTPNKSFGKKKRKAPAPPPVVKIENTPSEDVSIVTNGDSGIDESIVTTQKRIPLSAELFDDEKETISMENSDLSLQNDTYRRKIVPLETSTENVVGRSNVFDDDEKVEEPKDAIPAVNPSIDEPPICLNKSDKGKWKRRKGPAPSIPVEVRKSIKAMSPDDIKRELEVIEVQQIGLEKQGVMLEKIIREKCEGADAEKSQKNSKVVEDLIMQLFDVVNEKNEIFRKQQELMYWRKQYRLETEQQELDQEIRKLMAQPEENKTDGEKAREEALIARLIEVVKQRNAVVESLETDRVREMHEDASIRRSIEKHAAKFEQFAQKTQNKLLRKKEKKEKKEGSDGKQKKKKNVFNRLIHSKHKTTKETEIARN
ncbi:MICAL-like protein 1 [Culicoides brevitarsis]|uniref:MICAL-like protein 1 n=1 Tax=Culicoides brevitarsis TaxID=469753 RepID=UPI00307BFE29